MFQCVPTFHNFALLCYACSAIVNLPAFFCLSLQSTGQQSVTAVLFQGGEKLISSGAVDGQIKIWDLRKTYTNLKQDPVPFHVFPYPGQGLRKHGRCKKHLCQYLIFMF